LAPKAASRRPIPLDAPSILPAVLRAFIPSVSRTISETGLSTTLFEHLLFNTLYSRGGMTGRGLEDVLGVGFEVIETLDNFLRERYERDKKPFRRCHPRDILLHVTDMIDFLRLPHLLTEELLNRAFESCFKVSEEDPG